MRVIREFPFSERIKASLFSWNGKYILKLESGNLEQTYKISELDTAGEEEVLEFCRKEDFRSSVIQTFVSMDACWLPAD
jgi:hypothetical protein